MSGCQTILASTHGDTDGSFFEFVGEHPSVEEGAVRDSEGLGEAPESTETIFPGDVVGFVLFVE